MLGWATPLANPTAARRTAGAALGWQQPPNESVGPLVLGIRLPLIWPEFVRPPWDGLVGFTP